MSFLSECCPKAKPYNCCSPTLLSPLKSTSLSQKMVMQRMSTSWSDSVRASGEGEYDVEVSRWILNFGFFSRWISYQAPNKHNFGHSIHVAGLGCTIISFLWSLLIQATKQIFDHSTHVAGVGCRIRLAIKCQPGQTVTRLAPLLRAFVGLN